MPKKKPTPTEPTLAEIAAEQAKKVADLKIEKQKKSEETLRLRIKYVEGKHRIYKAQCLENLLATLPEKIEEVSLTGATAYGIYTSHLGQVSIKDHGNYYTVDEDNEKFYDKKDRQTITDWAERNGFQAHKFRNTLSSSDCVYGLMITWAPTDSCSTIGESRWGYVINYLKQCYTDYVWMRLENTRKRREWEMEAQRKYPCPY